MRATPNPISFIWLASVRPTADPPGIFARAVYAPLTGLRLKNDRAQTPEVMIDCRQLLPSL